MGDHELFFEKDGKLFVTWKGVDWCLSCIKNKAMPFKYVVGVERGGMFLALMLSEILDIPWGMYNPKNRKIKISGVGGYKDEDILLIDDIEDSSKTLQKFKRKFPKIVNTAVLIKRRSCINLARAEAMWLEGSNKDLWVVFPWEIGLGQVKKEGKDYEKGKTD